MHKRRNFFPVFLIFLLLSLFLLFLPKISFLKPVNSFVQAVFAPVQSLTYGVFSKITSFTSNTKLKALEDENKALVKKLIDQQKLIADNKALRDQFQTANIRSASLVPAQIVGAPGFVPGVSVSETLILNRGESDGVKIGNAVIFKDNLVGRIIKTSQFLSSVLLITNSSSSFIAKTVETNALGVVKGQGGGKLILDNVLLPDNLKKNDIVVTKGDINENGVGFPPDLIVGRINSISKNASDLFQKAEITTFVDFGKINVVFIIIR